MTEQQKMEIIKALAYGNTPEQVAAAEDMTVSEILEIATSCEKEVTGRRDELRKAGYVDD